MKSRLSFLVMFLMLLGLDAAVHAQPVSEFLTASDWYENSPEETPQIRSAPQPLPTLSDEAHEEVLFQVLEEVLFENNNANANYVCDKSLTNCGDTRDGKPLCCHKGSCEFEVLNGRAYAKNCKGRKPGQCPWSYQSCDTVPGLCCPRTTNCPGEGEPPQCQSIGACGDSETMCGTSCCKEKEVCTRDPKNKEFRCVLPAVTDGNQCGGGSFYCAAPGAAKFACCEAGWMCTVRSNGDPFCCAPGSGTPPYDEADKNPTCGLGQVCCSKPDGTPGNFAPFGTSCCPAGHEKTVCSDLKSLQFCVDREETKEECVINKEKSPPNPILDRENFYECIKKKPATASTPVSTNMTLAW